MTHNTDPGASLPQPDLHFEHYGARVYLYNAQAIAAADPGASLRLYENTELANGLAAVGLDTKVELTDGGPILTVQLGVQLAAGEDRLVLLERLQRYVESDRGGRSYTSLGTAYGNVVRLNFSMGMEALAWFNEDKGELFVSNNVQLGGPEDGHGPVTARPVLLERLGSSLQLMMMSRFMAEVLSYGGAPFAERSYHIGEQIVPLGRPGARPKLGAVALSGEIDRQPSAPPTQEETLAAVEREMAVSIDDKVLLDEVAGNAELKGLLRDVVLSFKHVDIMKQWGVRRPQGVLLYGDPGTGKTMLIEALANEIGAELRRVQSSDIYGKWLGESEANIKRLFTELRAVTQPTVVFFDEIEAIIGINTGGGSENTRNAVAGIFKQELNDLARQNPNVLVAAATNELATIDPSLIRSGRFDHIYEVALPDAAALGELFASNITRRRLELETDGFRMFADDVFESVPAFAAAAEGLSGADVVEIFRRLCFAAAMNQVRTGEVRPITRADLLQAINDLE